MAEYIKHRDNSRIFGTIDTRRWQELQKQGISPEGMYLLTELLVGRFRNPVGVIYIPFPLATLAKITGMDESTATGAFRELEARGLLEFDQDNEVIFLKEFWRHNIISSVKHTKGACARIMELPQNNLFPSMAKLFTQCLQEAAEYDKRFPPGASKDTGEKYSTVLARYEPVFKAIMERIEDTPIDTPIDTHIDTTETETETLTLTDPEKIRALSTKQKSAGMRVSESTKKQNSLNFQKVDVSNYPAELVEQARRFTETTSCVLEPEAWADEIAKLPLIDPNSPSEGELSPEELETLIESFFGNNYSKANDRSIVLFNNPQVKKFLVVRAGFRSLFDYD